MRHSVTVGPVVVALALGWLACGESPSGPGQDAPLDAGLPRDASGQDAADPDAALDAAPGTDAGPDAAPDAGTLCSAIYYLDSAGDDAFDGSSPALAVATLDRVHGLVTQDDPTCDVEIRINQGTYLGQTVIWTWYRPGVSVKLMPIDYQGGGIDSIAGRPVFDGQGASYFFRLAVTSGAYTNLELLYLQVEHYVAYAVHFAGNRNDFAQGWNGGNRIFGCLFQDLGNLVNGGGTGYAGVDLVNSRENVIRNNHFMRLENSTSAALIHGIYLAHGSSSNTIESNRFDTCSGDPIRARDDSSHNVIRSNRFYDTGVVAYYSDWWCDMSSNPNCTKAGGECPSWENEFRNNELHCGYGGAPISTFAYLQGGETNIPAWCTDHFPQGWARLYTSGNVASCP